MDGNSNKAQARRRDEATAQLIDPRVDVRSVYGVFISIMSATHVFSVALFPTAPWRASSCQLISWLTFDERNCLQQNRDGECYSDCASTTRETQDVFVRLLLHASAKALCCALATNVMVNS